MTDYIERKAIQAALQRKKVSPAEIRYTEGWNDCMMRVKSMVSHFPAADVVPVVHGKWIYEETRGDSPIWKCSRCGRGINSNPEGIDLYCYHCGAKMDKKEN